MQSISLLRLISIIALLFSFSIVQNTLADSAEENRDFPYTAYVGEHGASVLSGPDDEFYATERLEWGTKVEVFRHDDVYAAVRPTAASFSWVPANAVQPTDEPGVFEVVESNVHTRIGSKFNDEHAAEYVKLRKGELLEVLGKQELDEPAGVERQSWFKVSPPAGEFRWIRLKSLSESPPTKIARQKGRRKPKLLQDANEPAVKVVSASSADVKRPEVEKVQVSDAKSVERISTTAVGTSVVGLASATEGIQSK